jgi:hypothetical protein
MSTRTLTDYLASLPTVTSNGSEQVPAVKGGDLVNLPSQGRTVVSTLPETLTAGQELFVESGGVISHYIGNASNVPVLVGRVVGAFGQYNDSDVLSGNERGNLSVDLQRSRQNNSQVTSGQSSFSVGKNNTASGENSIAMGAGATASGLSSVAIGDGAQATGSYAVALGRNSIASGFNSLCKGTNVNITGTGAVGFGSGVSAPGQNAFVINLNNSASGPSSFASGVGNTTPNLASAAFGAFCQPFVVSTFNPALAEVFKIGIGTDEENRLDALRVLYSGIIVLPTIPTSSSGLPVGALYRDGDVVKIVT